MKKYWVLSIAAFVLGAFAVAQVGASGSTSGGASVTPGQANAIDSNQNAQVGGASASSNVAGSAQASHSEAKHEQEDKRAGTGSESTRSGSAALNSSNTLHAELTKPIDAGKAKPGDEVSAKLTQDYKSEGKVVFHKGSKLKGHVTEAQGHTKDHAESRLGVVFDKVQAKGGEEASVQAAVQALAPPVQGAVSSAAEESLSAPSMAAGSGGGRSGGGLLGGVAGGATSTVSGAAGGAGNAAGGLAGGVSSNVDQKVSGAAGTGLSAQGTLTNASRGAIALQGLSLSSVTGATAQASVISSATRTVKLESGTQMLLQLSSPTK